MHTIIQSFYPAQKRRSIYSVFQGWGYYMRIEKISDNKIKVLIDDSEAKEWNITFKSIS